MNSSRIATRGLALRSNGTGTPTVTGHAAVFFDGSDETQFEYRPGVHERIAPTAFEDTLESGAEVVALVQHDTKRPIGRRSMGTLRLSTDQRGLAFELDLPDTNDGRDMAESIRRGDVDGMSIGFETPKDGVDIRQDSGHMVRTLKSVVLREVSPVTFPAYRGTSLALRTAGAVDDVPSVSDYAHRQRRALSLEV